MNLDETLQNYFETLYQPLGIDIQKSLYAEGNEIYGELYYYSVKELLKTLDIQEQDHFLDLGSGLGKIAFQTFMSYPLKIVTGIEINEKRHHIAIKVKEKIQEQLPKLFDQNHRLNLLAGDFFNHPFEDVTIIYICSLVFSYDLLSRVGEKINSMPNLKKIASIRKIPGLENFRIKRKLFLHGNWDRTSFYIYERI